MCRLSPRSFFPLTIEIQIPRDLLRPIIICVEFDLNAKLIEERFEFLIQRSAGQCLVAQPEQEAQVYLVMIWVQSMSGKDNVVGSEDGAERSLFDVVGLLRRCDDLV